MQGYIKIKDLWYMLIALAVKWDGNETAKAVLEDIYSAIRGE